MALRNEKRRIAAPDAGGVWMNEATDPKAALNEHAILAMTDPQGGITSAFGTTGPAFLPSG